MGDPLGYVGVIPARGGSKGIPRKNLQELAGVPLVQHTIAAALGSARLDRVVLSSDDDETIELARSLGCDAPFVRPPELSDDASPLIAAVLHAVDWLAAEEGLDVTAVVALQPTSPFRDSADIDGAIAAFESSDRPSLMSVVPALQHPADCVRRDGEFVAPAVAWPSGATSRQDLPDYLYVDGAIYVARVDHLRAAGTFRDDRTAVFPIEPSHGMDIDDPYELELARAWAAYAGAANKRTT